MPKEQLSEILKMKPNDLQSWVQMALSNAFEVDESFNWLGLAEALAFDARESKEIKEKEKLAKLAANIYEWLIDNGNLEHSDSNITSLIAIMTYMLSNNYVDLSHPLFGENKLSEMLWKNVDFSASEALEVSKKLNKKIKDKNDQITQFELEELKKLRRIKNRLSLVRNLSADSKLIKDLKFGGWFNIYEILP